jgi:hypothetical protein
VAALIAWLGAARPVPAAPVLSADATTHDFGRVEELTVHHRFTLSNRSEEPLRIASVLTDCEACVRWRLHSYGLGANEQCALDVFLETGTLDGPFEKTLRVQCAGVTSPAVVLTLTGVAVPFYRVTPPALRLVASGTNVGVAASVRIESLHDVAGALSRAECDLPCLKLSVEKGQAANPARLDVQAVPPLPEGLSESIVHVTTGVAGDPTCRVRIALYAVPDVEVLPSPIVWDATDGLQTRIVFVRANASTTLTVLDAVPPEEAMSCHIVPERGTPNCRIHVSAEGLQAKRGRLGDLKIVTAGARRELRVPMSVR